VYETARILLAESMHVVHFNAGDVIYHEGDGVDGIYICATASVALQRHVDSKGTPRLRDKANHLARVFTRRTSVGYSVGPAHEPSDNSHHVAQSPPSHMLRTILRRRSLTGQFFQSMPLLNTRVDAEKASLHHVADTELVRVGDMFGSRCVLQERRSRDHSAVVVSAGFVLRLEAGDFRRAMVSASESAMTSRANAIRKALHMDANVPFEVLLKLAHCMVEHAYEANHVLARQGQPADALYVILSGACIAKIELAMTQHKDSASLPAISPRKHHGIIMGDTSTSPRIEAKGAPRKVATVANVECLDGVGNVEVLLQQRTYVATVSCDCACVPDLSLCVDTWLLRM
jgi:CRP-like cAMP-binding protein